MDCHYIGLILPGLHCIIEVGPYFRLGYLVADNGKIFILPLGRNNYEFVEDIEQVYDLMPKDMQSRYNRHKKFREDSKNKRYERMGPGHR